MKLYIFFRNGITILLTVITLTRISFVRSFSSVSNNRVWETTKTGSVPVVRHHSMRYNIVRLKLSTQHDAENTTNDSENDIRQQQQKGEQDGESASKREMLLFAIPALGIYLANPLLSNIDNAFIGNTVGTLGLAALSPATICTDQMLYLFSFLSRSTTGIVARAYGAKKVKDQGEDDNSTVQRGMTGNVEAAREAASTTLTVSLICGAALTMFYAFFTPTLLAALKVNLALRPAAASYIYWRGAIAWAALAQSVCLSIMMATRDAITPLKIIGLAAIMNILADYFLCAWPLRLGCAGAAAATSFATLFSCTFMVKALANKKLLPKIRIPKKKELLYVLDFIGPLFFITITRLGGFIVMQNAAMRLGTQSLAGYQLCINLLLFFLLFGEPLSQLFQTKLPAVLDRGDGQSVLATLKSVLTLGAYTSFGVAAAAYTAAKFGSRLFTSDFIVQQIAISTAPTLFVAVATSVFTVAVDGMMIASRDFKFMLAFGSATFLTQVALLPRCHSVGDIISTFTLRLATYAVVALVRLALGYGVIGKAIKESKQMGVEIRQPS